MEVVKSYCRECGSLPVLVRKAAQIKKAQFVRSGANPSDSPSPVVAGDGASEEEDTPPPRVPRRARGMLAILLLDYFLVALLGWCLFGDRPDIMAYLEIPCASGALLFAILAFMFRVRRPLVFEDALRRLGSNRSCGWIVLGLTVLLLVPTSVCWSRGCVGGCIRTSIRATTPTSAPISPRTEPIDTAKLPYFAIYTDSQETSPFTPTGHMGDLGDIRINENCRATKHTGSTSIRVEYDPRGDGDEQGNHMCRMGITSSLTCKWAGVYWLHPADNWGQICDVGYNLTGFRKLSLWARTEEQPVTVQFLVGGVGWGVPNEPPCPDSLREPKRTGWIELGEKWKLIEISLDGADLGYVIGGFAWVTNWDVNEVSPGRAPFVFYLDDVRFER